MVAEDDDVAGGLMITEYLAVAEDVKVGAALDQLVLNAEDSDDHFSRYVYVLSAFGRLVGVAAASELAAAPRSRPFRCGHRRGHASRHPRGTGVTGNASRTAAAARCQRFRFRGHTNDMAAAVRGGSWLRTLARPIGTAGYHGRSRRDVRRELSRTISR